MSFALNKILYFGIARCLRVFIHGVQVPKKSRKEAGKGHNAKARYLRFVRG